MLCVDIDNFHFDNVCVCVWLCICVILFVRILIYFALNSLSATMVGGSIIIL